MAVGALFGYAKKHGVKAVLGMGRKIKITKLAVDAGGLCPRSYIKAIADHNKLAIGAVFDPGPMNLRPVLVSDQQNIPRRDQVVSAAANRRFYLGLKNHS